MGAVNNRGLCICGGGAGSGRETSVLALNLAVNLKLLPQKNFLLKIQPSSLKIYVLPLTCQISKSSLKERKKKQKDSLTHQILKTTAYQENHSSGVR